MFPQRLKEFARMERAQGEVSQIALRCPCGGDGFGLQYDGIVQKRLLLGDVLAGSEANPLGVSVECPSCGRKAVLFDGMRHGYDAVHAEDRPAEKRRPMKTYACRRCKGARFGVEMRFEYAGMEEIAENLPKDECFSWLWVDIECRKCGKRTRGFVDVETA